MEYKLEPIAYKTGRREEVVFGTVSEKTAFAKVSQVLQRRINRRPKRVSRETPITGTHLPPGAGPVLDFHLEALKRVVGLESVERQKTGGPIIVTVVPLPHAAREAA